MGEDGQEAAALVDGRHDLNPRLDRLDGVGDAVTQPGHHPTKEELAVTWRRTRGRRVNIIILFYNIYNKEIRPQKLTIIKKDYLTLLMYLYKERGRHLLRYRPITDAIIGRSNNWTQEIIIYHNI